MSFGKIHHWLMMGAMLVFASAAAAATAGGATSFLTIAWTYVKHITVDAIGLIGPAIKGLGAAVGNLGAMFGIDPGSLTAFDPSSVANTVGAHAGHGAAATGTAHAHVATATAPVVPGGETLTQHFTSRSEWFGSLAPDLQDQFRQQASAFGKSLADVTAEYCTSNGLPVPAAW